MRNNLSGFGSSDFLLGFLKHMTMKVNECEAESVRFSMLSENQE
jgi:hypothetical protein